jgi:rRNA maturation endonuclease Nob1
LEAHRSYERFEEGHRVAAAGDVHGGPHYGRNAALAVAVMAAFLALATFLANEAVKEVVTGETHRADTSARLESNRVKIDISSGNAGLLQALGAGSAQARQASAEALRHETRIVRELEPADAHLTAEIQADEEETDHANTQHLDYELAEVGLQVGIVLASVSIIARRRWLLACGGVAATAGVLLLAAGLLA